MNSRQLFLITFGLVATVPALAADWRSDAHVGVTALYSDNYRLATSSAAKQSVSTGLLDLSTTLSARTPTSTFLIQPRLRGSATTPNIDQNATDGFLNVTLAHKGQKSNASLVARYSHQNLFRLYLPNGLVGFDLGSFSNTQTLRAINGRNAQNLLEVNPSANWRLTQRVQLQVGGYYSDSAYTVRSPDYIDYRNGYGYVGLGFDMTRQDSLGLTVSSSQFQPSGSSSSNTVGVQAEWNRRISEVSRYYFRLGNERTRFGGVIPVGGLKSASSASGGAGISWVFQVTGLFLDATRNVYPNSTGTPLRQTELRARLQHLYSPRTTGWVSLQMLQTDRLGGATNPAANADGGRYLGANLGVEWRFTKTWSLTGSANLVQQRLNLLSTNARSNELGLTVSYEPGRKAQDAAVRVQ